MRHFQEILFCILLALATFRFPVFCQLQTSSLPGQCFHISRNGLIYECA
jgi:hypothetical protein